MEGSADPLSASQQRYGLAPQPEGLAEEGPDPENGQPGDEAGRKHMSAHERRLQKKLVPPALPMPTR